MSASTDRVRRSRGFLTADEAAGLVELGVEVLDPNSTLVSPGVSLAAGVVLYPGVVLQTDTQSKITIDEGTVIFPGSLLLAEQGARISIGVGCEIGPGGVQIKANRPGCAARTSIA